MIDFADLDMMARGGAIALLTLWSWLLVRDHWQAQPARVAVCMNVAIICHVIATISGPVHNIAHTPIDVITELGSAAVPGFFWLFARTWFNDETCIGWRSWSLILIAVLIVAAQIVIFERDGAGSFVLAALLRTMMFGFAVAGLWAAWQGREGDLVEARRRLRAALVGAVGAYVILTNGAEIGVYLGVVGDQARTLIEFGIVGLTFAFCAKMFVIGQNDLFASTRVPTPSASPIDDPLANRLLAFMEHQKPHRDETLTIAALAAQLGEQEYRLRRLINGQLGYRNFATFLNGYRLSEVKAALTDPSQRDVPILTIALDAGFGSLGPFNRAFREAEGMTPSAFRATLLT